MDDAHELWIVDAMNVIGARPDGWWRDRAGAVRRLVAAIGSRAARTGERVIVVVDGRPPAGMPGTERGDVRVVYARRAGPDAADDRIVELVAAAPEPTAVHVVTSDRALGARVRALGAVVTGAGTWLRTLERPSGDA